MLLALEARRRGLNLLLLFPWFEVMRGMPPYHEQGNGYSYCAKRSRYDEAQMVESEPALP
jgi:hypothetical protein